MYRAQYRLCGLRATQHSLTEGGIVDMFDGDKRPRKVVTLVDTLETRCLCGEAGGAMKISYFWFDAGEFVDVADCFHYTLVILVDIFKVGEYSPG